MNKLLYTLTMLVALCPSLLSAQYLTLWNKNARYYKRSIECGSYEHQEQLETALSELIELIVHGKHYTFKRLARKYDKKLTDFFFKLSSILIFHKLFITPDNKVKMETQLKMKLESLFDQTVGCTGSIEWIDRILKNLDESREVATTDEDETTLDSIDIL